MLSVNPTGIERMRGLADGDPGILYKVYARLARQRRGSVSSITSKVSTVSSYQGKLGCRTLEDVFASLRRAVMENNVEAFREITIFVPQCRWIEYAIVRQDRDSNHQNLLHVAVSKNLMFMVKKLLLQMSDYMRLIATIQKDGQGCHAIYTATRRGDLEMLGMLLEKVPPGLLLEQLAYQTHERMNTLQAAVLNDNVEIIELLLKQLPQEEKVALIFSENLDGVNSIEYAVEQIKPKSLDFLLSLLPAENLAAVIVNVLEDCAANFDTIAYPSLRETLAKVVEYLLQYEDYEDLIMHIVKSTGQWKKDGALSALVEEAPAVMKELLPRIIDNEGLRASQIDILAPLSDDYILPITQTKCRRCAFICYNEHNRENAREEAEKLESSLSKAGFTVKLFVWSQFSDLRTWLSDEIDKVREKCSLLFLCVMSHGFRGNLQGQDGSYGEVNELLNELANGLPFTITGHHVPVVFLVQACQADLQDAARGATHSNYIELRRPHTVLLMATVSGGWAYRGLYTTAIADEIAKADGQTDLMTMHIKAAAAVKDYQTAEIRGTMHKRLILPKIGQTQAVEQ